MGLLSCLYCPVCLSVTFEDSGQTMGRIKMKLNWHAGRPQPWPHCVRWRPSPSYPQKGGGAPSPIFGLFLLWPNGLMHQAATWCGGRPEPGRLCDRWGPSPPPQKGADHPIFSPRILWPNGWMDQDGTWHGDRSQPRRLCVRWGPSFPPLKGNSPQFLAIVCCGQTAG